MKTLRDTLEDTRAAYTELWAAVENGTLKADFSYLREKFRDTVQS